ncbi:MAG: hypothetical protein ACRD4C_14665 [Candidatus Acidiferrales bacterium]
MRGKLHVWKTVLIVALLAGCALAQDDVAGLQSRFARDTDPIHRAKSMRQLGRAEFQEIEKDADAGELAQALATLREYRDEAQSCEKALDDKGVDAEKHPNGFKQLQFSVRESLLRLDNLLVTLTADQQKPFLEARQDLDTMNRHLLHELFPNNPAKSGPPEKPKG